MDGLAPLRRKLAQLGLGDHPLDTASAPLVEHLLADLLGATESYRALQAAAGQAGQASETAGFQAEVLRREVGRLTAENARVHADLLREADARQAGERAAASAAHALEAQLAEAQLAQRQAMDALAAGERERAALKSRVADLLAIGQHIPPGGPTDKASFARMTITRPLEPRPSPAAAARTSRGGHSLLKVADARVLALEAALQQKEQELAAAREAQSQAEEGLRRRDAEIARLGTQAAIQGPDLDRLTWQYRNEANEALILQLNAQVEALTRELSELQARAVDRGELEAAQRTAAEAEGRASTLAEEREGIAAEVEEMQRALVELQRQAAAEGAARAKLGRLKASLEDERNLKAQVEGQLTHAETKVLELRDRLESRETALRKLQQRCKVLEAELSDAQKQLRKQAAAIPQPPGSAIPSPAGKASGTKASIQADDAQLTALWEQVNQARQAQREVQAAANAVAEERAQLQEQVERLGRQLVEAQQQLAETAATAALRAAGAGAVSMMGAEASASEESRHAPPAPADMQGKLLQAQDLQEQLERLEFERTELAVHLEESQAQVEALTARVAELEAAADAEKQQDGGAAVLTTATLAAKGRLAAGCAGSPTQSSDAGSWRLAAGGTSSDTTALQAELEAARQSADAARQQQESLQLQMAALQTQVQEKDAESARLRADLAAAQAQAGGAEAVEGAVAELRRQLEERSQQVADLSALGLKADSTIQQYMAQLRSMATELRAAELSLADAETELTRQREEVQQREAELGELRGAVGALDAERDALHAELDRRAEAAAAAAEGQAADRSRVEEAERALAAAEARGAAAVGRAGEAEAQAQALAAQVEALNQHLSGMEQEYNGLREQYRCMAEDLAAAVREQQAAAQQLSALVLERDEAVGQAQVAATRAHYNEQMACARESEAAQMRTATEGLVHENRRLQEGLAQAQRDALAKEAELARRSDEIGGLREALRAAQSQVNLYLADLQAWERHVDGLNRAMQRSDGVAEGLDKERAQLLDQLRGAEQLRFQMERQQEALQRQLVAAEGGAGVLQARLAEAQGDIEALQQRVGLEQAKVGELEGLLAVARAEQWKSETVAKEGAPEKAIAGLKEQRRVLEERVATLQRQVDGLVARRDAQEAEIARLKESLAAQFGAGSGEQEAREESERLAAQLAEVEQRCRDFVAEAEVRRSDAEQSSEARAAAEAALAAAQEEVRQLKAVLQASAAAAAAEEGAPPPGVARARLAELEQENRDLAGRLAAAQDAVAAAAAAAGLAGAAGGAVPGLEQAAAKLAELQAEHEQLLELLGAYDTERVQLQREKEQLVGEVVMLRAVAPLEPDSSGSATADGAAGQAQGQQAGALAAELEVERQRRQQAEADFRDLLQSLDLLQGGSPASSAATSRSGDHALSSGVGGPAAATPPSSSVAVVGQLQGVVAALERENGDLKASLEATRGRLAEMHGELAGARSGVGAASGALQSLAAGMQGMGSGSSVSTSRDTGSSSRGGAGGAGGWSSSGAGGAAP